ncbi:MAG: hypothetical protein AAB975_00985, partial [Patescibacteria group bacterium]
EVFLYENIAESSKHIEVLLTFLEVPLTHISSFPSRYRIAQAWQCIFAPVCKSAFLLISDMLIEPRLDDTIWQ